MRQQRRLTLSNGLTAALLSMVLATACGSSGSGSPPPKPAIPTSQPGTAQRLVAITTSMPTPTTAVAPATVTATGKLTVNMETGQIGGSILFSGLTSTTTGASIRLNSDETAVVATLSSPTGTTSGAWTIPADTALDIFKLSSLTQGDCHFRLDTQNNQNGEKRGDIVFPDITITTTLLALQGTGSTGAGQGNLTINLGTGALSGSITFSGLTSNATEGHISLRSDNSDVVTLQSGTGAQSGTFTVPTGAFLSTTQLKALVNDGLRIVVNSENFPPPSGELLGDIVYPVTTIPTVSLAANQEVAVPPVVAPASSGTGRLTVNLGTGKLSGSVTFKTSSLANSAHIHQGFAGENGSVLVTLQIEAAATSGTWTVPDTTLNASNLGDLISGRLYLNIHTASNSDGEIRGQIVNVPTN